MIKKPGTAEWELERIGAPERTPQPESNPSFVPAAVAAFQVPLGLRRRDRLTRNLQIVVEHEHAAMLERGEDLEALRRLAFSPVTERSP